jgi:D-3-phosphoglycerate dehydrogenase
MPTVLVSAPYIIPVLDRFRPWFAAHGLEILQTPVNERLNEAELLALAGQFDATICGDDRYTPAVLAACAPRLKVISKWGTGIDSIDSAAAARLGIGVYRTPNAFSLPVADSVLGYMLAFARRQPWLDRAIKRGEWEKLPGRSLSECTLGVIGAGDCGKAVLRRARAFGMRLLANDIRPLAPDFLLENYVQAVDLDTLLAEADFISVNADLNPTSYHLLRAETLAKCQPSAVIINTARGPIVDEAALIAALQRGGIAGAALDVFEVEPLPLTSPLLTMDNIMLAPHNANSSPAAWERVHQNTLNNLLIGLNLA